MKTTMPKLANLPYKQNLPWLEDRTILLCRTGSRAYGTNRPDSDEDIRGIAVAPIANYLGFLEHFEQAQYGGDHDATIYDIRKFFKLAADCNPNILELLFVEKEDVLFEHPAIDLVRNQRQYFLSERARYTYSGYAMAQLKRIKGHRSWLLNPPKEQPTRVAYGLPEHTLIPKDQLAAANALVQRKLDEWSLDLTGLERSQRIYLQEKLFNYMVELSLSSKGAEFKAAARTVGLGENLIEVMNRERSYRQAKTQWRQYNEWKNNRNPVRAALEAEHGYDCKHGMHLVRLLRTGYEILKTGELKVRRPDAEQLKEIRDGAWSYDELICYAENMRRRIETIKRVAVPKKPNRKLLEKTCVSVIQSV